MHKLRRMVFFDRQPVELISSKDLQNGKALANKEEVEIKDKFKAEYTVPAFRGEKEANSFLKSHGFEITCVCGSDSTIFFGDRKGNIHWFHEDHIVRSTPSFGVSVLFMSVLEAKSLLVCIGKDEAADGGAKYRCYSIASSFPLEKLHPLREARLFTNSVPEQRITCFDANPSFTKLALGTINSSVCLFRGDLLQEKSCRLRIIRQNNSSVVGVHFSVKNEREFIFICTSTAISSYLVPLEGDLQLLFMDESGSNSLFATAISPSSELLVLRNAAVFTYDCENGNLSAFPCEGYSVGLITHKRYFVAATTDASSLPNVEGVDASAISPRHTVYICLSYPEVRFLAFSGYFNGILHIISGLNAIYLFSTSQDNQSVELFRLREKGITERLHILLRKRLFEWATSIALNERQPDDVVQEIYRLHGDWLYEKKLYDQALSVYTYTIGFIEPSYVIEKFLDSQRIPNLAQYLLKVHEAGLAVKEHTMMLFKCYTAMQEIPRLESFLSLEYTQNYDCAVAIDEFRDSGYSKLALDLASKRNLHDLYVTILIEDLNDYNTSIQYMRKLDATVACALMMKYGRLLLKHEPESALLLIHQIMAEYNPGVDVFIPLFVDCMDRLESFLEEMIVKEEEHLRLNDSDISPYFGPEAILSYLDLLLRRYKKLNKSDTNGGGPLVEASSSVESANQTRLSSKALEQQIMKLTQRFCKTEEHYHTMMNLCEIQNFHPGIIYCSEKIGNYQLPLSLFIRNRDTTGLLQYCTKTGLKVPMVWTEALAFLITLPDAGGSIRKVLSQIWEQRLLPPLAVLSILQSNSIVKLGAVKEYLLWVLNQGSTSLTATKRRLARDADEIHRMKVELEKLKTSLKYFEKNKCSQCELMLDLPAVHCYCGHSFHINCIASDYVCHKCRHNVASKKMLIERRILQANNTEDFFKYLKGSTDGLGFISSCFGKGMFSKPLLSRK